MKIPAFAPINCPGRGRQAQHHDHMRQRNDDVGFSPDYFHLIAVCANDRCRARAISPLTIDDPSVQDAILERLEPTGHCLGMLRFTDE